MISPARILLMTGLLAATLPLGCDRGDGPTGPPGRGGEAPRTARPAINGEADAAAQPAVWLDDLADGNHPPAPDARAVAAWALRAMSAPTGGESSAELPPASLAADTAERLVVLSVSDGRRPARVHFGGAAGTWAATRRAVEAARRDWPADTPVRAIALDVVTAAQAVSLDEDILATFGRGLTGLAMARGSHWLILPDQIRAADLADAPALLPGAVIARFGHLPLRPRTRTWTLPELTRRVWAFRTRRWFADANGATELFRGHRMIDRPASSAELLADARRAGAYLARAVKPGGRFVYEYRPAGRQRPVYNLLRHAGSVFSMWQLVAAEDDPPAELTGAAERATEGMLRFLHPRPGKPDQAWAVEDGEVKLGGNALVVLALLQRAEATGDRSHLPIARRLARWMLDVQDPNGRFTVHKIRLPGIPTDLVSTYYPGEAIFALARLARWDGDGPWLDAADRGARWLITVRDAGKDDTHLPRDHWLLYALNELHRQRSREIYLDQAERITRAMIATQLPPGPEVPADWVGGFGRPPRCTPAAVHAEGMSVAWKLLTDHGRADAAAALLAPLTGGVRFQRQCQVDQAMAMHYDRPDFALGGFPKSPTDPTIRIDYVQHNLSALLGLREVLGRLGR